MYGIEPQLSIFEDAQVLNVFVLSQLTQFTQLVEDHLRIWKPDSAAFEPQLSIFEDAQVLSVFVLSRISSIHSIHSTR